MTTQMRCTCSARAPHVARDVRKTCVTNSPPLPNYYFQRPVQTARAQGKQP